MKTSELIGPALDWAVAKCEKVDIIILPNRRDSDAHIEFRSEKTGWDFFDYHPSTGWAQAGPIIEREKIQVSPHQSEDGQWEACKLGAWPENYFRFGYFGPTPLIAVMRCFVASKLGDDVEIPENLK